MCTFPVTAVETVRWRAPDAYASHHSSQNVPEVFSHPAHSEGPAWSASCRRITSGSCFLGARGREQELG
jgi:hypothetical protein